MSSPVQMALPELSRRMHNAPMSQAHRDITDEQYHDLRRPRKVRFYVNGDRYFKGKRMYITPHRYLNFNDLLNDLTGKLPNSVCLPYGVRQIFTPNQGRRVFEIKDLLDGEAYVCAGFEGFKVLKYGKAELEPWSVARPHNHGDLDISGELQGYRYRGYATNNAFHPGRYFRANGSLPNRRWPGAFGTASKNAYVSSENVCMKPKVITIVRNGNRPRNSVKILLNRRSVQSFEQLMADISEAFGPKWKNNKVRKLYTTKGREVQGISDFFRHDDLFVASGNEAIVEEDLRDILQEMYPDCSPHAKNLHKEWERSRKKKHAAPVHREVDTDKRDSGFGEPSEGSNSNRDSDHEATQTGRGRPEEIRRRDKRDKDKHSLSPSKDTARDSLSETPREQPKDAFGKGIYDERERARRRQQKMLESEKRALEDERRKRGLVPLKAQDDPFKKMKEREKEKLEARRKKDQEKKRQMEEEEKERRRKEFEEAEKAARARKAAAEKEEREREEREKEEKEKAERKRAEQVKEKEDKIVEKEKVKDKENKETKDNKDNNNRDNKENKDNEKHPVKKRQKTKIVRRTKAERQIPNDEPVLEKYDLGRTLGDGNFAIVRTSKSKSTGQEFAMKVIDKPKLKGKEHMVENEIEIMKDCNHHNIVKLYEEFETPDKLYLVMELVKGGDLFDAITQSVKFGEVDSANMVKDLCHALFYLHSRNIVHRDLKPENLLVHRNKDSTITLKLADFGLAMDVKELIYTVCGTPTYVAPEILSEIGYGLEVDMWAVGVISYILLCGFPPFRSPDRNQTELFEFIKSGVYEFLSPYWDYISDAAKDMIQHLLVVDKKRRYTAVDVLSHPWILAGGDMTRLLDSMSISEAQRERRKELETQARQNLDSYTRMKEKRRAKEE
ncbi:serine/threonine-protein kinase DCLK3-like [Haliotis asinina]|uniref:serine/threonine-protein kinase DCLK3-like n=1 Tax=Haliotis asinina TaxID=109174 RepID=UPI0035323A43